MDDCSFVSEGEVNEIIEEFAKHTEAKHGIDYSKESLMQIILRKTTKKS